MGKYNCLSAKDFMHEVSRIMSLCANDERGAGCIKEKCESCPLSSASFDRPICLGWGTHLFKEFGTEDEFRIIVKRIQEWSDSHPEHRIQTTDEIAALTGLKIIGYKYIAADKNGDVFAYSEKPAKDYTEGRWIIEHSKNRFACISFNGLFEGIAFFTDEEPMEIDKLIYNK